MSLALVIGTRNAGKFSEIKTILGDVSFELHSLSEFETGTAEENGDSYRKNAILKAQYYAAATGLWTLADDSGLEVEALGGAPGIFSARYAGDEASDSDRRVLLLSELSKTANRNRNARFVCAVAIADPNQEVINVSEGICNGTIGEIGRGDGGFGYDPLFIPDRFDATFAELPESVKNRISHRARALVQARDFLLNL
jgi:XTP/dITP diphosphohydrolase